MGLCTLLLNISVNLFLFLYEREKLTNKDIKYRTEYSHCIIFFIYQVEFNILLKTFLCKYFFTDKGRALFSLLAEGALSGDEVVSISKQT